MGLTITTSDPALPPLSPAPLPTRTHAARWPVFGVIAGVTGFASALVALTNTVSEEDSLMGVAVIDELKRGNYYVSFLLGLVSIAALMVTAAAWHRWADDRAPRNLAARTIGSALAATATINIIGTALAGSMAIYLPGGADEGWLSREAIFVNYTLLDFGQLLGWWGAMVAAGCVAVISLRKSRLLPRWMGIVSIVLMLPAIVWAVSTGLPGFPGLVMPIWLVVISLGMMRARNGGDVDQ